MLIFILTNAHKNISIKNECFEVFNYDIPLEFGLGASAPIRISTEYAASKLGNYLKKKKKKHLRKKEVICYLYCKL